jgi:hypothetical protein
MSTTVVDQGTFTAEQFRSNAELYNISPKLRRAFDAIMACGCDEKEVVNTITHVKSLRDRLHKQSENGAGYTPDKALGFGSENAAGVADTMLCRRPGAGVIRTAFAKAGS